MITRYFLSRLRRGWCPGGIAAPILGTLCLGAALSQGFASLWIHERTAGRLIAPPAAWPQESSLPGPADKTRLVLFAHPNCPCTNATLSELERVIARFDKEISACIVFYQPQSSSAAWLQSRTWRRANEISGLNVFVDEDGVETRRFHAMTSGMTVAYGEDGRLLFAGGITPGRGHEGRNAGEDALLTAVANQIPGGTPYCVFGCPIFSPAQSPLSD